MSLINDALKKAEQDAQKNSPEGAPSSEHATGSVDDSPENISKFVQIFVTVALIITATIYISVYSSDERTLEAVAEAPTSPISIEAVPDAIPELINTNLEGIAALADSTSPEAPTPLVSALEKSINPDSTTDFLPTLEQASTRAAVAQKLSEEESEGIILALKDAEDFVSNDTEQPSPIVNDLAGFASRILGGSRNEDADTEEDPQPQTDPADSFEPTSLLRAEPVNNQQIKEARDKISDAQLEEFAHASGHRGRKIQLTAQEQYLKNIDVTGVMFMGNRSKALINNKVFYINNIISTKPYLKLVDITPHELILTDESGRRYRKDY